MPSVHGLQALAADLPKSRTVSLPRPNDTAPYLANDVIGDTTAAGGGVLEFIEMGPAGSELMITGLDLRIDAAAIISGETTYRLHLYSVTPPSDYGDNAAWDLPSGDRASYLGAIDISTPVDEGSTLFIKMREINAQVRLAETSLWGYLVTVGPHTPTALRAYSVTVHAIKL